MLTLLRIRNLALVEDLTVEFGPGYNAVTGETGAGKSVLIGALSLVLGERADRTLIRAGAEGCAVEAVFRVGALRPRLERFLAEAGVEAAEGEEWIVKRAFTAAGANRQFVNGSPTTLPVLAQLGEWLVDIHGPYDHQSVLQPSRQLDLLDAFGGLAKPRQEHAALVDRRAALLAEKRALIVDERTYAQQLDLLRFQTHEIEAARLQPDEETELELEHRRASNAARLIECGQAALQQLADDDASLIAQAGTLGRTLQELRRLDPAAAPLTAAHERAAAGWQELQADLARYVERLEIDPERFRQLEERVDLLHSLRRKYGATIPAVIAFGQEARRKLHALEQRDAELVRIQAELDRVDAELRRVGEALSAQRRKVAPRLRKAVMGQLADLGFRQCDFRPEVSGIAWDAAAGPPARSGLDAIEFQFAPNPGEPPRPLRAIASSGELARVMLALKTVLAAEDEVPVLVFDEVDANIGGETAQTVGEKMRQLGARRQVFCITHLAPVAARARHHFVVDKEVRGGRTVTLVRRIEGAERVTELARMLGGQTDAARKHAEELLERGAGS